MRIGHRAGHAGDDRVDVPARRTLTLYRLGAAVRTMSVVVGKRSTPTPTGLFAVTRAIRWHPNDFLGSWVLELTAHSDVLQAFDGGDGTVGIHGRGGTSLVDPLGSASSHGCIRLSNNSIDGLVQTIRRKPASGYTRSDHLEKGTSTASALRR